jgi:hypothetical protein
MLRLSRLTTGLATALISLAAPALAGAHSAQRTHGLDPEPAVTTAPVAAAAAAPGNWCPNSDPGANQTENGQYRYHAIYAYPADRPNRLRAIGAELQQAAFGASALIERQYRRAIRFDIGTPCGPGQLDISAVRLPFTSAQLRTLAGARGTATFDAVAQAMRTAGYGVADDSETPEQLALRSMNFLVWLDGPSPSRSCGQGTALIDETRSDNNLNNFGGKLAVIFRDGSDFCGADVVRHEIGHNLGALQPDAPNTSDGVHCNDAFEDTMCAWESPQVSNGPFNGMYFDYGNDDYWDPPHGQPLGWWTLNLSRFLCPTAGCNRPEGAQTARTSQPRIADRERAAARRHRARAARRARRPHVSSQLRRGARRTRMYLTARGAGSARLVVSCPRRPSHRRVLSRRIALPHRYRVTAACRHPRAKLTRWHRPRAARFLSAE